MSEVPLCPLVLLQAVADMVQSSWETLCLAGHKMAGNSRPFLGRVWGHLKNLKTPGSSLVPKCLPHLSPRKNASPSLTLGLTQHLAQCVLVSLWAQGSCPIES